MRCQKVRSYLSAYCNDELAGRKKLAVDEHLSTCALCRKEESLYNAMFVAKAEIPSLEVSKDFNNSLLNRIANERFAETRTKAYHPQNPPLMAWSKVVPAVASAFVVVFTLFTLFSGDEQINSTNFANLGNSLDDSYLTAQPTNNPNMNKNWSLDNHLAKVERSNRISRNMMPTESFSGNQNMSLASVKSRSNTQVPYVTTYYKVRKVIRLRLIPHTDSIKEVNGEY